ncbi:uncharacterized protein LOC113279639 [Papaver somniferum]|uniref:uncharacterized protein LOC113279639 n=1 Tax=Papaver somniferum TaxID=3469 RepID=UPI000E6F493B|nr:uncharacterized protein LOC113279639 [Papaver somniferum]
MDVEKAYDKVNWHYLDQVMEKMGFGNKWRRWIFSCISAAHFSILINGSPGELFISTRGLRQGDAIPPFMFTIVMEGFSKMIMKLESQRMIEGFKIITHGTAVTHLLFADDMVIFTTDSPEHIHNIRAVFICFELVYGLSVNPLNSRAFGIGNPSSQDIISATMGCSQEQLPLTYLGMPAGSLYRSKVHWAPIIERTEKNLQSWQRICLTYGGRLVLIQFVLSTLAIYMMSVFSMPASVAKKC